jgi:hypothetical protein
MKWKGWISNLTVFVFILSFALFISFSTFILPQKTYADTVTPRDPWTNIHSSSPSNRSGTIDAGSLTVSTAGTNRLYMAAVCLETNTSLYLDNIVSNVSLGGTPLTKIGITYSPTTSVFCYMGYLKESQIPAGSNTLSVDYDTQDDANPVTGIHVKWASYSDVLQMLPINDSHAQVAFSNSAWFGDQIDYTANGLTLYVTANGGTPATMTPPTDFSQVGTDTTTDGFSSFIAATSNHLSDGNYPSNTTANFGGTTTTRSAIVVASLNPSGATTIVGDGESITNATICPGDGPTDIDAFTLQTSEGTDTVTYVEVTFSTTGFYQRLSEVQITSDDGSTVYGSVSDPSSDTVSISVTGMPDVTSDEAPPQYKVRITPKSNAGMPSGTYSSTGKVTGITSSNQKIYHDTNSATITIDNFPPFLNPSSLSGVPGDEQVILGWSIPVGSTAVVILRNTSSPIGDTPVEGVAYSRGDTIGSTGTVVVYDGSGTKTTDTELSNGQGYYYKIFGRDDCYNYTTAGYEVGPYTPAPVVIASSSGTQVTTMNIGSTSQYIGAAFAFKKSSGADETITKLTISETGTAVANTKLNNNVKVYYESNVPSCSTTPTGTPINTSFNSSDKIVLDPISIPVTTNYTCFYVVFDVDPTAVNNSTVKLEISSSADFTLGGGTMKDGSVTYPVALGTTTINGSIATLVKVGSFSSGISTGDVPVTGVGFQPKAVIFYWTRQNATGFSTGMSIGEGFAVAGTPIVNRGVAGACDDNVTNTKCGRIRSETYSIMFLLNGTATTSGRGYVKSFDPDGFTVTWPSGSAPGMNTIINYMAISGDAITNVKAGTITAPHAPAGPGNNQSYTGVGFQPDFVMFLSGFTESVNTPTYNMIFNTGFMTSSGQASVSVCGWDSVAPATDGDTQSRQRTDRAIMSMKETDCTAADFLAGYVSMNPDGFTLNFYNVPVSDTPIFYLALKGGKYKVGSFTQPYYGTPPITQDTLFLGFQPNGLFMASFNRPQDTAIGDHGEISIGAASSPTQTATIWGENRDLTTARTDANMSVVTDKVIRLATSTGSGDPTIDAEAEFVSFIADGFRLNWTTRNDNIERQIVYWAITGNPITVGTGTDLTTNVYIGPGAGPTELDAFTLQSSADIDIVSGVTVTLTAGTYAGLSKVQITDGSFIYGEADPASDSDPDPNNVLIQLNPYIELHGGDPAKEFKVMIIPKPHTGTNKMPDPPGQQYSILGKVTNITATNTGIYSDTLYRFVVVDNLSPTNPTNFNGLPSEGKIALTWNLVSDCNQIIILRSNAAITDIPTEGASYNKYDTIGLSTVVYVHTGAPSCSSTSYDDTEVINGQTYYYKIFAKDLYGNYSSDASGAVRGTPAGPYTVGPYVTASYDNTHNQTSTMEAGSNSQYIGTAFTFQQVGGTTPDTITRLTISETGTADANVVLHNVKVYYESDVASCSATPTGTSIDTTFSGPPDDDKIVLNTISIPLTLSPKFTCVHVVFDVDLLAVKDSTVDLEITSPSDFTLSSLVNKRGTYPVNLSGIGVYTTLQDTLAPNNITNLTVTPGDTQVAFSWTNPSDPGDSDFVGVCIMRASGIPPVPPPASCPSNCSGGTKVEGGAEAYIDSPLSNGTTYSYRLCSYDETPHPNQSSGVEVRDKTPSSKPILSYPAAPYNDGKDPDTGDTTTDFRFKVIYSDWQNDAPDFTLGYPKIYIGDNDGYVAGYDMSPDTSVAEGDPLRDNDYRNGEQYVYGPIGLGAAADLRFYFKAQAATGEGGSPTPVTLPLAAPGLYATGPSVSLLPGYNLVGVPKDLSSGYTYSRVLGDDSGYVYCQLWDSYGLDITEGVFSGEFFSCTSENIVHGKGYYIYALAGTPKSLDEPPGVVNVTADHVDIALDPDGGWTMISNPYNARIKLEDVKVVKDSMEYDFIVAVNAPNEWIDNSINEWEGFVSGYSSKAFNGSPPAVLEPWVGYFIYVKDTTTPIILRIYKP